MIFGRSGNDQQNYADDRQGNPQQAGYPGYGQMPAYAQSTQNSAGGQQPGMGYVPQQSGYGYAGQPGTAGYAGQPGTAGYAGQPAGMGYGSQPVGTGYAGYTPGAGGQNAYAGYGQNGGYQTAGGGYGAQNRSGAPGGDAWGNGQSGAYAPYGTPGYNPGGPGSAPYSQSPYGAAPSAAQPGSYIPQTPYSQGYATPGYQQNAAQGYGQMGRGVQPRPAQPQNGQGGIPMNGAGYVPPAVNVRRQAFRLEDPMLILISAVLLALGAVGLFVPSMRALLWVFLALTAAATAFFWARPVIDGNKRLCFTVIFGALALVALLQVAGTLGGGGEGSADPRTTEAPAATASPASGAPGVISTVGDNSATPTPAAEDADDEAKRRVENFFYYWMVNKYDDMLALCAPSWQSSSKNPRADLFGLISNRVPLDYEVEKISGTPDDTSRKVTVVSTIDRNLGKDPVRYRLSILILKEGDVWYVDPQSLKTYENADTPDPATLPTPTPTPVPAAQPDTVLYYNPDKGTKYHLDPNCKSTHAKYLPFKGHFKYSEVNDDKYKNLEPCNVCAAPLRPQ